MTVIQFSAKRNTARKARSLFSQCLLALIAWTNVFADQVDTLRIEESEITLVGKWVLEDDPEYGYSAGTAAVANWLESDPGAHATFEFDGTGLIWIGARTYNGGLFDWIIDENTSNERSGTVNTYISGVERVTTELLADDLEPGHHTLKFISLGIHGDLTQPISTEKHSDALVPDLPSETYIDAFDIINAESAPFAINPGLNDAWVSVDAPLQGFFFTVFPDLEVFFLSWFTFDSEPPANGASAVFGTADQRWVTGAGAYSGNNVTVNVELTSGGIFDASEPLASQQPGYGTITIVFNSCNEAVMSYDFPSQGLSGQMTLTRVLPDNVALCQALNDS